MSQWCSMPNTNSWHTLCWCDSKSYLFNNYIQTHVSYSNIIIYVYPTRCNVAQFILSGNWSTCFGWYHHPSSGAQTTVSTASGICHTISAICRYRGRVGTDLSVLWAAYATHSTADSNNGVTNTRFCRYSCLRSWWWVVVSPEICRAVSMYNKLCNAASCWIYIRILLRCTDPWALNFSIIRPFWNAAL